MIMIFRNLLFLCYQRCRRWGDFYSSFWMFLLALSLGFFNFGMCVPSAQARGYGGYSAEIPPSEVFPDADRFGPMAGERPQVAVAYRKDQPVGYVFFTSDNGYSGKPIEVMVGMTREGLLTGAKVIKHSEPILLVGIPEQKLFDFVTRYVGRNLLKEGRARNSLDAISGATVTAIVIDDGITRSSTRVARQFGLEGFAAIAGGREKISLKSVPYGLASWSELLGEGAIHRLHLQGADVDAAFAKIGVAGGALFNQPFPPEGLFIDLYAALVTPERIGANLLGRAEYGNLTNWLAPGQQALLILGNGDYSFRGSGFVRGGIFDRFTLVQGDDKILFRDHHYRRLGRLAEGMPEFAEIGVFKIPEGASFDPAAPWAIELLVQRSVGILEKAFVPFNLSYTLPESFLVRQAVGPSGEKLASPASKTGMGPDESSEANEKALWQRIWDSRLPDIMVVSVCMAVLFMIFFLQDLLIVYPRFLPRLRLGFWLFSVFWIGGYAQAQLSVVNVLTFLNALMTGFQWDFFLLEPVIFLLWCGTAVALLFWGRGAYCGWVCAFGALQGLLSWLAKALRLPQLRVPPMWNERLWAIKYVLFLALFGLSLHSMAVAEHLAEVEPFKTVVMLRFVRDWPFVLYALTLLGAGLFVERFFCRYLCPLGAALAIPGRLRIFDWLKRRRQCGFECSLCGRDCMVQAIHPTNGQIHPNECHYCLDCQVHFADADFCPPLIQREKKHHRRAELKARYASAKSVLPGTTAPGQ